MPVRIAEWLAVVFALLASVIWITAAKMPKKSPGTGELKAGLVYWDDAAQSWTFKTSNPPEPRAFAQHTDLTRFAIVSMCAAALFGGLALYLLFYGA